MTGSFGASDLFFEQRRDETELSGVGALNRTGTASGQSIHCLGFGTIQVNIPSPQVAMNLFMASNMTGHSMSTHLTLVMMCLNPGMLCALQGEISLMGTGTFVGEVSI